MWLLAIFVCGLMALSIFMLAYTPKHIYKVHYVKIGFCRSEHCTFIKARNIADIQRQLEEKHAPWDIHIISVEGV